MLVFVLRTILGANYDGKDKRRQVPRSVASDACTDCKKSRAKVHPVTLLLAFQHRSTDLSLQ